jgi:hypothetical protein
VSISSESEEEILGGPKKEIEMYEDDTTNLARILDFSEAEFEVKNDELVRNLS